MATLEISGNCENNIMMKKISRRSFLRVCGITAATAALTACGGGKTETTKKDDTPPSAGQTLHGAEQNGQEIPDVNNKKYKTQYYYKSIENEFTIAP